MLKYLSFHNSSFAFKILLNVNGKARRVWHIPCLFGLVLPSVFSCFGILKSLFICRFFLDLIIEILWAHPYLVWTNGRKLTQAFLFSDGTFILTSSLSLSYTLIWTLLSARRCTIGLWVQFMPNPKPNINCWNHFNSHTKSNTSKNIGQTKIEEKTMYVIESPTQESTKSNIIIVQTHFATTPKPKKWW